MDDTPTKVKGKEDSPPQNSECDVSLIQSSYPACIPQTFVLYGQFL